LKVVVIGGPRIREMLCPCGGVSSWIGCERPRPNLSFFQSDNQQDEVEQSNLQRTRLIINNDALEFEVLGREYQTHTFSLQIVLKNYHNFTLQQLQYLVKYELSFFIYFYLFSMKLSQSHYLKHKYCELTRVDLDCFMIYEIIFLLAVQVIFRLV
jgi:hypothetical protein